MINSETELEGVVTWRNITKVDYSMQGGIKTLTLEWDNGETEKIYGSCLDMILKEIKDDTNLYK